MMDILCVFSSDSTSEKSVIINEIESNEEATDSFYLWIGRLLLVVLNLLSRVFDTPCRQPKEIGRCANDR